MELTLKEVNELNKEKLTLKQVRLIHDKHGYAAEIFAGKIVEFVPKNFGRKAQKFLLEVAYA